MRLVINGKIKSNAIEDVIYKAYAKAIDIIEEENNDLYKDLAACHSIDATSIVVDIGFTPNEGDEAQILATDAGEVLTFQFDAVNDEVKLTNSNKDTPLFSDTDRAYVDLAKGLQEVAHTIDVTGVPIEYSTHVGGLDLTVYANGAVIYYKDGKLVQEATVQPDKLQDFINEVKGLVGDN